MSQPSTAEDAVSWARVAASAVGGGVAVLALYLVHPLLAGYRFPIGPDGPVYTWLARAAEATGLPDGPGSGPGVVGVTLTVGRLLGNDPLATVTILGPVLAAACGLAAAGLVEAALGPRPSRALIVAVVTGAFTAYLAGGWLANVAMTATYLGALAALAVAHRSWRAVGLAGALLAASGLSHRVFLLVGVAILVPVVAVHLPQALAARRAGSRWGDTAAGRMAVAVAGGGGLAAGGLAWLAVEPAIPGDTSQDGFFRRLGLRGFLVDRYRERFGGDLGRAAVPLATGLGLATAADAISERGDPGRRYLVAVWLSWAAITAGGIVVLAATAWGPPNRMLQFAFFVPIGAAVGAEALARRGGRSSALALVAVPLFVAVSMIGWFRQSPAFTADDLAAAERAGAAVATTPAGTPLIFVVDTDQAAAAYHVTRTANVIRMGLPAERIADARVVVGRPDDVLAGRVTRSGDPEHDRIAAAYLREASPVLDRATIVLVRPFAPAHFEDAGGREVAPDVIILRGRAGGAEPEGDPDGLSPIGLVAGSIAALGVLGLLGGGWARWGLPGAGRPAATAVAPSAGIAVSVVAPFLADRLGAGPASLPAIGGVVVLAAAGYVAAWAGRGQRRRARARVPPRGEELLHEQRR